jgi:hypothetical protein
LLFDDKNLFLAQKSCSESTPRRAHDARVIYIPDQRRS